MKPTTPQHIQRVYVWLTFFNILSASLIWGVNTLFLLDAGLTITQAFLANAFFTVGQVLFEVPTGVVADTWGRRASYLLGTITLSVSTLLYLGAWHTHAAFWVWAVTSILLGLGFTFFSGATEAWLVDALNATGYKGKLETVFGKAQIATGVAMLTGSVSGGVIAQFTNLGVPYVLRAGALIVNLILAWVFMKDLGFKPVANERIFSNMKKILRVSVDQGLKRPPIRWVMIAGPFGAGVGIYAFYAMQPYLLQLYGDKTAYAIAGLTAAIVAGSQIAGGFLVPHIARLFSRRTTVLATGVATAALALAAIGLIHNFWAAVALLVVWGLVFAATMPVRQAYLNGLIPSEQRATVLSFDNMLSSTGGAVSQPGLGKIADIWGYGPSYVGAAAVQILALPFLLLARRTKPSSDPIQQAEPDKQPS
jgi:MFS family permease